MLVESYVASSGRDMEDVVAYTVFSTQDPAKITLDRKDVLHTLGDLNDKGEITPVVKGAFPYLLFGGELNSR